MILDTRKCRKYIGHTFKCSLSYFIYVGKLSEATTRKLLFHVTNNDFNSHLTIWLGEPYDSYNKWEFQIIDPEDQTLNIVKFPFMKEK